MIYFVVPIDIVPDWFPAIGIIDDFFILGLIIKQVNSDLEDYKVWKKLSNEDVDIVMVDNHED